MKIIFFNHLFNKKKLRTLLLWCVIHKGQAYMLEFVENLKVLGFQYATKAGLSLGIDDLKTVFSKYKLIVDTNEELKIVQTQFQAGLLTEVEQSQYLIDNWQKISEILRQDISLRFKTTDKLNPIYMMAFSGARGNISQVRQLIGMRGLMSDPNGEVINLPIKSNFREGLTVTEYLISCYGARKGVVDTALRTATAGYLTRRLVDSVQHVIVSQLDCGTRNGVILTDLHKTDDLLLPLSNQIFGRITGSTIYHKNKIILKRNSQIDQKYSKIISNNFSKVFVRSSLNCKALNLTVCQLCYGWNLSHLKLVSLGEVIGVIAAQSIGEPGTQLTMRTFHTGGVFSGSVAGQIYAPFDGIIRYHTNLKGMKTITSLGANAFIVKQNSFIIIDPISINNTLKLFNNKINSKSKKCKILPYTLLFVKNNQEVKTSQLIAKISSITKKNQEFELPYIVKSKVDGELVISNSFKLNSSSTQNTKKKLWILYGKFYKSIFPLQFFPEHGDFINSGFPIASVRLINTFPSFLRINLVSKNPKKDFTFFNQKYQLIFSLENIFHNFCLDKIIEIEKTSFLYSKPSKVIEYKKVKRLKDLKSLNLMIKVPVLIGLNNYPINNKTKQINIFSKRYKKSGINKNYHTYLNQRQQDKLIWYPPESLPFIKSNYLIFYENIYPLNKKNHLNNYKSLYLKLFRTRSNFIKDNILYIKDLVINSSCVTSDYLFFYKIKIIKYNSINQFLVKSKNLVFYPKTKIRLLYNTSFSFLLDKIQVNNSLVSSVILRLNIFSKFLSLTQNRLERLNKMQTKISRKISQLEKFLILTNLVYSSKLENNSRILYQFNKFIKSFILFSKYKKRDIFINSLDISINSLFHSTKFIHFYVFYNNKLFYKILVKSLTSSAIEQNNNILLKNNFLLNATKKVEIIPLSVFRKFKYLFLSFNYQLKQNQHIKNYSINRQNLFSSTILFPKYFLNIKALNSLIYLSNFSYSSKKIMIFNNFLKSQGLILNSLSIPRFFLECSYLTKRLFFWSSINKRKINNFFYLSSSISHLEFDNISNYFCTRRLQNFSSIIYKNNFKSILSNNKNLLVRNFRYITLKYIKIIPKLYDIDYKNNLTYLNKKTSSFLFQQKQFELFTKNNYLSHNSNIDVCFLKKNKSTKLQFSCFYKLINISFYINIPVLTSFYLVKNQRLFNIVIKNKLLDYKPVSIVSKISKYSYSSLAKNISNSRLIKVKKFPSSLYIYFTSSFNHQLIKRELSRDYEELSINNRLFFSEKHMNWLNRWSDIVKISFHSPYTGDVIKNKFIKYSNMNFIYNRIMILTKKEKNTYSFFNYRNQSSIIFYSFYFISLAREQKILEKMDKLIDQMTLISPNKKIPISGQFIDINYPDFSIRKGKPLFAPTYGLFYSWNNDFITRNSPIMTLLYRKLQAGDIIQGIPKIENFFEARKIVKMTKNFYTNSVYLKISVLFNQFRRKLSINRAVKRSIAKIQKILIDGIMRVYCEQGISVSRKHFEIIIKQMTSRVKIIDGGETGLLEGELVSISKIEKINQSIYYKYLNYEPLILGITQASLKTDSFISSASFQETIRVLSQAAIENKIDFLSGLKENVILGKLIPGGTGIVINILSKFND
uniref:DNA-directed RNA polymerase n=1 Tax=Gymnochlora stellata TaxID=67809 RepID=A0A140JZJ5_GYMST|nr:RNA polymerase beta prime subunit [Gymnochlora stellata]BAU62522.1 RNA polymerase beta prime subunit [Gymnochlora stellata]